MVRFSSILLILLSTQIFSQNVKTGSLIDLFYMDDSLTLDSKRFGIGGNISSSNLKLHSNHSLSPNWQANLYNVSFSRYYVPAVNNEHNFIVMNSFTAGLGEKEVNYLDNTKELRLLNYHRARGIGYNFDQYTVIPYTSRGSLIYNVNGESFSGRTREIGVNINLFSYVGVSLSYNHTIFEIEQNLLEKYLSRGVESVSNSFLNYGLSHILLNTELYPVYYWLANTAYNFLFISLNRSNYNFPFNHSKQFEVSSYNLSVRFELGLF